MSRPAVSKRLTKEIVDAQAESIRNSGIYNWFDEADVTNGRALIIGPKDTPYAFCPLLFNFKLPPDYPFNPPAAKFMTSDGKTRFHPNLYVEGKVCLSILGTWQSPKWSAVMTISTVLSSIQSLLEANPITNEPGWEKFTLENPKAANYAAFVQSRIVELSFRDLLRWRRKETPPAWAEFQDVLDEIGEGLVQELWKLICEKAKKGDETYMNMPYGLGGTTGWKRLLDLGLASGLTAVAAAG